jgi:hypothetical protein
MVRRRRLAVFWVTGIIALGVGSYALAGALDGPGKVPDKKDFKAKLNGFQETPSVSTTGWGTFRAELVEEGKLHYVLQYAGLEGASTTASHVHVGQRGIAGGVSFFLCGGGGKPACPAGAGTVEGDVVAADVIGPVGQGVSAGEFAEALRMMQAGHAYANVHTPMVPSGEIRGQINDSDQKEFDK